MSFNKPLPDQEVLTTTLTIRDVQESDFGEYVCRVENNLGKSEMTIDVSGKFLKILVYYLQIVRWSGKIFIFPGTIA